MSIQDWSEADSSDGFSKKELENSSSELVDNMLDMDLFEKVSLEKTYSLYVQGLNIGEIAEIEGLSVESVCRQFEKLVLAGKVRKIEGLVPSEKQKKIKSALEVLETEINSLIRMKVGEGCQEEELKLIRAFLLSKMLSSA